MLDIFAWLLEINPKDNEIPSKLTKEQETGG